MNSNDITQTKIATHAWKKPNEWKRKKTSNKTPISYTYMRLLCHI